MRKIILIVEDNPVDSQILVKLVERQGFEAKTCAGGFEAISLFKSNPDAADLVLLDINMPDIDGISLLGHFRSNYPNLPVIMVTSSDDVDDATQAMKLGALDFLSKPVDPARLDVSIHNALRLNNLDNEVKRLKKEREGHSKFDDIIGHDGGLQKSIEMGRKAAGSDISVLVTGESGVGKELFAQAIHGESKRAGKPFIAINCGALPKNLVESILFGHEKGSFTGAVSKSIGKFREAAGGTIFLDEIGELPLEMQVKLLRVIQQREIEPVGLGKSVPVDVRIISATNRNLAEEVKHGRFREDLFFRLNTLQIEIPSLRERIQDLPKLVSYFVTKFAAAENKPVIEVTPEILEKLGKYQWPGNVRELENIISRSVLLTNGRKLEIEDLGKYSIAPQDFTDSVKLYDESGKIKSMDAIEEEIINFFLNRFDNKVDKVSEVLGISKATIYRRLQKTA